jgi:S-formylglutathione hydrolase FrmB
MIAQARTSHRLPGQGVVVTEVIPTPVSHFVTDVAYVYLPPAWFATPRPALPTLILLPGEPGTSADWTASGDADNSLDAFAAAHHGRAPIVVMPDPDGTKTVDSECVNSTFGNAETYLAVDVPAFARRTLGAADGPRSLAVAGLSAGGTCSTMLALRHPGEFETFASYSGFAQPTYQDDDVATSIDVLFGGSRAAFDAHDPTFLLRQRRYPGLAGWFEVGDQDTVPRRAAEALAPAAHAAGIDTCVLVRPGGHDFGLWRQAFADSLPWLAWRMQLTPEPAHVPADCEPGAT